MSTNPYTPPNSNDVERAHFTVVAQLRKLVQPLIAAGVTLVLWVAAIAAYAGVFGHPHSNVLAMIVWAASLVLSLIVGIVVVTRSCAPQRRPRDLRACARSLRQFIACLRVIRHVVRIAFRARSSTVQ